MQFFAIFLLVSQANSAYAERVSVVSAYGSQGQGWLFGATGSSQIVECWIAVPEHVVNSESGEPVAAFRFADAKGYSGETDTPVTLVDIDGALDVLGKGVDLAFAKVKGPRSSGCLSRLGLPEMVYQSLLRRAPRIEFFDMLETSFGIFSLDVRKVQVDALGGGLVVLGTADQSVVNAHFSQGLSGSIGTVKWQQAQYPFVMVSRINASSSEVIAVRFDVIRQIFDKIDTGATSTSPSSSHYAILGVRVDPGARPSSIDHLLATEKCWRVSPPAGERHIELLIEAKAEMKALRGIALNHSASCGGEQVSFSVDQRTNSDNNWVRVRDCVSTATSVNNCHMDLRTPRQIRLTIGSVDAVSFSHILLY